MSRSLRVAALVVSLFGLVGTGWQAARVREATVVHRPPAGPAWPRGRALLARAQADVAEARRDPGFTAVVAGDDQLGAVDGADARACLAQPAWLRFVWLSDVQLRDPEVRLRHGALGGLISVEESERDPVQERYAGALFAAHVAAIETLERTLIARGETPLAFMVHTGDAIDAGTVDEMYAFVATADLLPIPWLGVVGNHDTGLFGNHARHLVYDRDAAGFRPLGSLAAWLYMHRAGVAGVDVDAPALPLPADAAHAPSLAGRGGPGDVPGAPLVPGSACHGFDLVPGGRAPIGDRCEAASGHYAVDVTPARAEAPVVRLIALDTRNTDGWDTSGHLPDEQRAWLSGKLAERPGVPRVTLVLSHHPVPDYLPDPVGLVAGARARGGPVVFLTGHSHQHHGRRFAGPGVQVLELNTGAVLDYPQIGRVIELRGTAPQACLVSRAIWPSVLARDRQGLAPTWDADATRTYAACAQGEGPALAGLGGAVACARAGAIRNHLDRRREPASEELSFDENWRAANVVLPLALPAPTVAERRGGD